MENEKQSPQLFEGMLFPKIFQTFRIAIHWSQLMFAFLAVVVIFTGGRIMDINKTVVATLDADGMVVNNELQVFVSDPTAIDPYIAAGGETGDHTGFFRTFWQFNCAKFHAAVSSLLRPDIPAVTANIALCFKSIGWAIRYHTIYSVILLVLCLAVISIAGGAICRIAALQFARGEKPGVGEALRFSVKKFLSFFASPLVPVGMIACIGIFVCVLGLLGNIPIVGELLIGVFMPFALVAGALIAVVFIGAVAGFNLMFPAVAYDGSDCFDAISRAFNYIYSRPWRLGLYTLLAAVYGAICYTFVRLLAFLLLIFTYGLLELGLFAKDNNPTKLAEVWSAPAFGDLVKINLQASGNWSQWLAGGLIYLFLLVIVGLVVSFVISFYFTANTIIYALVRSRVDSTGLDEIYTHLEEPLAGTTEQTTLEETELPAEPQTESDDS